jgi:NADH dehydrogenase FAD-containing subunit
MGIEVHENARVTEVTNAGVRFGGDRGDRELGADAVVWTSGFRVPDLARQAGFAVDRRGRMMVDRMLRSRSHPNVYAAGDVAAARTAGGESRMSCQTGLPMGLNAADAIAATLTGREPKLPRIRYFFQNISLGRHDGITQFTRADDSIIEGAVLTGRAAAGFKEMVLHGTVFLMRRPGPYGPVSRRGLIEDPRAGVATPGVPGRS